MKKYLFLALMLTFVACNSNTKSLSGETETLKLAEDAVLKQNVELLGDIRQEVMDLGNLPEHTQLLEQIEHLISKKEQLGLNIDPQRDVTSLNEENVKKYLGEIEKSVATLQTDMGKETMPFTHHLKSYRDRIEKLLEQPSDSQAHFILLNLHLLEGELLKEVALYLGHA